jgi:hypothetical protein
MQTREDEIAQAAARLVAEEGLDYAAAKRRALRDLGLGPRTALPDNERVEDAVREYLALFMADTQPLELAVLRAQALRWMERLAPFRPHLAGAVWRGTATRLSDIVLDLFCDDPKSLEIHLVNQALAYEAREAPGAGGRVVPQLSLHHVVREFNEEVGVHLRVHDLDALRGALKPDARGRSWRGDARALRALLADGGAANMTVP